MQSGRWEEIWTSTKDWFEEPVPVYDEDTGRQVGTQSRGRAIGTNPVTIGVAGAAALLGGEAIAAGAAAAEVASVVEETGIAANAARGLASEARVLQDLGLTREHVVCGDGRRAVDPGCADRHAFS